MRVRGQLVGVDLAERSLDTEVGKVQVVLIDDS